MVMFKLAIRVLEVEQATLLNALDRVVYGSTKASIKERLQLIEQELDELYALTAQEEGQ
jgi:hypothetical protein